MTPVGWLLMSFTACGELWNQKQLVKDSFFAASVTPKSKQIVAQRRF